MRYLRPAFLIIFGAFALINGAGNLRFEAIRTVDVVKLVGAGACLGVGLMLLIRPGQSK
jgi:hypothetical protein